MSDRLLVYGATGYTGKLIARHATERGLEPILAGRSRERVEALARPLGCEFRSFGLDDVRALRRGLRDVRCVLHVAGPFSATARPMVKACIAAGAHYLDVTGEIDVFQWVADQGRRAQEAGVMLLPGVGFDVVPSDCLAAHTAARVDAPRVLRLAIDGAGSPSRGTAKTALEGLGSGLRVRRGGRIVTRPTGSLTRDFDFGRGPRRCVAVPWGDVATAWHSTRAPDIEVYFVATGPMLGMVQAGRYLGWLLSSRPARTLLGVAIDRLPEGPSDDARERERARLVAEVEGSDGSVVRARLETPSGYKLTQLAAVEIARRVLAGEARPGYQTPATAFGADLVLTLPGCKREDA